MALRVRVCGFLIMLACAASAVAQQTKLSVFLAIDANNEDLRDSIRSALSSELRQLGDVVITDDSAASYLILSATAVGDMESYAVFMQASAEPLVISTNRGYVRAMRDSKGCVDADKLTSYLDRINQLIAASSGAVYRGGGRETLRNQCAKAVVRADNGLFKAVRQIIGVGR